MSTSMWSSLGSSRRYLREGRTHLLSLLFYSTSPLLYVFLKSNSDDGMGQFAKIRAPLWVRDQVEQLRGLRGVNYPWRSVSPLPFQEDLLLLDGVLFSLVGTNTTLNVHKSWETLQNQAGSRGTGPAVPPSHDPFPLYL
jgi:hypothetical protein